ncbi:MAG: hypothetical protein OIF58_15970 [Cohaesibacter sp.]|nr:hypothetical protein [Cohaesibacter sp.]
MSTTINFYSSLSEEDLEEKLEIIQSKHPDMLVDKFVLTEAFDIEEREYSFIVEMGVTPKVSSSFSASPSRGELVMIVREMVDVVKSEFESDQIVALWEMDYIIK